MCFLAHRFRSHDNIIPLFVSQTLHKYFFLYFLFDSQKGSFEKDEYLIGRTIVKLSEINHRKSFSKMLDKL